MQQQSRLGSSVGSGTLAGIAPAAAPLEVQLPEVQLPEVQLPEVQLPEVRLPAVPLPVGAANVSERLAQAPALAISTVIFALRPSESSGRPTLWLPLVRRIREPFIGQWALPGGPLTQADSLQDAAARNLADTTGLAPNYLEQLYAFGGLHRSPSQRVVSIVYWAMVQSTEAAMARESENVKWFRADELTELAFDHKQIVDYALWRLRNKMTYGSIAYYLLGEKFTLAQVREVYEAVLGRTVDPANFRRQLKQAAHIEATDEYLQGGKHRPPRLYRYTGDTFSDSPSP